MSIQPSDVTLPLKALRQELTLGAVHLKNRVVMASLTRSRSTPIDVANDYNVECEWNLIIFTNLVTHN